MVTRRLYSLTAAGWSTVATLQARRAGAAVAPALSATPAQTVAPVTATRGSAVESNSSAGVAGAQIAAASAPVGQTATDASSGGVMDVSDAVIERTLSAALAHMPVQSQGPVWQTDAADDPGWVRAECSRTASAKHSMRCRRLHLHYDLNSSLDQVRLSN